MARRLLTFDILSDEGNPVARRYGLVFPLPDDWTLPMPARFVNDRQGIIRWRDVDPDYTTRSEPADTVAAPRARGTG